MSSENYSEECELLWKKYSLVNWLLQDIAFNSHLYFPLVRFTPEEREKIKHLMQVECVRIMRAIHEVREGQALRELWNFSVPCAAERYDMLVQAVRAHIDDIEDLFFAIGEVLPPKERLAFIAWKVLTISFFLNKCFKQVGNEAKKINALKEALAPLVNETRGCIVPEDESFYLLPQIKPEFSDRFTKVAQSFELLWRRWFLFLEE